MQNEHDNAVDKVLAALRDAAPPEGMDARIAHRLAHTPPAASRLRDFFMDYSPASVWLRGAFTGAVTAMLATCLVLFATHLHREHSGHPQIVAINSTPAHSFAPVSESRSQPCINPGLVRAHSIAPAHPVATIRPAVAERSRPLPAEPLTAQERDLVRFAHVADPQELATLNPEAQAKVQAQDEAEFNKFFAPPTSQKSTGDNE